MSTVSEMKTSSTYTLHTLTYFNSASCFQILQFNFSDFKHIENPMGFTFLVMFNGDRHSVGYRRITLVISWYSRNEEHQHV